MITALTVYLSMGFTLHHGDCLEVMPTLPDRSVDMILADLPYGTTACSWDSVIPFHRLWPQYKRIIKPNGAIVLTASQPFTSALVMSNPEWFKCEWIWEKTIGSNPMVTQFQPFKKHESVLVFSSGSPTYNPQMEEGEPYSDVARATNIRATAGIGMKRAIVNLGTRYPSSVQRIPNPNNGNLHPTQKPVALMEYLIRTYTNPGETVLDNTMGSGTTGVAAMNTDRKFIGIEQDAEYFRIAETRIKAAAIGDTKPVIAKTGKPVAVQPSLFSLLEATA